MDSIDLVVRAHELAISDAQYTLNDYKEMLKEQKCGCYTCGYAPNKECGWYAACNNCIDGSNYWRRNEETFEPTKCMNEFVKEEEHHEID